MMGRFIDNLLLIPSFGLRQSSQFADSRVGVIISLHGPGELFCFTFLPMTINNFSVRSTFLFFPFRCVISRVLMRLDVKNVITGVHANGLFKKLSMSILASLLDLSNRGSRAGSHLSRFFFRPSIFIYPGEDCSKPF